MSSPGARQRRQRQHYQAPRDRREVVLAVIVSLSIVGLTLLAIFMLRPGGIADRQPRATWLVALGFGAALLAGYVILRPGSKLRFNPKTALAGALVAILFVSMLAGFFWPGGLLRHTPSLPPFNPPPTTQTPAPGVTTTTTPAGGTTTTPAAGSTTTGAPTTTSAPSSTTATTIP